MLFVYTPFGASDTSIKNTDTANQTTNIVWFAVSALYRAVSAWGKLYTLKINMTLSAARRAAVLADKTTLLVYKSLLSAYWANLTLDFGAIDNIFL